MPYTYGLSGQTISDEEYAKIPLYKQGGYSKVSATSTTENPYSGKPARPDYASIIDPSTGQLSDRFKLTNSENLTPFAEQQLGGINLNTQALEELRRRGLDSGQSKWAQLALEQQKAEEQGALDEATRAGKGAEANTFSNLSMMGGLSGGERERLGYQSARDIAESRQKVGRAGTLDRYGINLQDENNKTDILKALPGLENQALDPAFKKAELMGRAKESDISRNLNTQQFNLTNLIGDVRGRNLFDMTNYGEDAKAWAANKEAEATAKSSGGGTHICTAVHREYTISDNDLDRLDKFRDEAMEYFPEVFKFYLVKCEELIPRMKAAGADVGMLRPFVKLVFIYIEKFGASYALDFYADYTQELIRLYMPELYEESIRVRKITGSH